MHWVIPVRWTSLHLNCDFTSSPLSTSSEGMDLSSGMVENVLSREVVQSYPASTTPPNLISPCWTLSSGGSPIIEDLARMTSLLTLCKMGQYANNTLG